jgi:PTH2 family peptidyl-tRNA hydrolase
MRTKQVICMRTDLNMRKGKMCAQAAHSSMAFLSRRIDPVRCSYPGEPAHYEAGILLSPVEVEWLNNSFPKICVGVGSEQELLDIHQAALDAGVESHVVQDNGTTEFGGVPTYTCVAIGPDYSETVDQITSHLKLL